MTIGSIGANAGGAYGYAMSVYGKSKVGAAEENYGGYNVGAESDYGKISEESDRKRRFDSFECKTCENRRYQDGSDDMGVSFQTPTKLNPSEAAARVKSHEMEHVGRNQAKAEREGREVVSQSVTINTAICPECGKVYVSGGLTRTVTRGADDRFNVGMSDPSQGKGGMLDTAV